MKSKLLFLSILAATCLAGCNVKNPANSNTSSSQESSDISSSSGSDTTSQTSKENFTDITFDNGEFAYDGEAHSIYVSGAPSFANVSYTNNNKVNVGTYTVTARISATNYNTLTLSATLRIIGQEITGVTFESQTVQYDGDSHSLAVSGLPSGVSVTYSNNNKTQSGTYTVTANLTGTGYEPLTLTAILTIEPLPVTKNFYFYNKYFMYDGEYHSVTVDYAPNGATVTYRCLNASGQNSFKDPGVYKIEATVRQDANHISKKYANLTIFTEATAGVDPSKTPLSIDENLTWDELHSALENGNFTLKYYSGSYDVPNVSDPLPDDLFKESFSGHQSAHLFATDGVDAFQNSYRPNEAEDSPYYHYYKECGDNIIHLDTFDCFTAKFPKAAFEETVSHFYASDAFVALNKGSDGEFLPGINGDSYYFDEGTAFIENGVFTVLMEHPRSLDSGDYRYFYEIYKYYNIGNTTVDVPSNFVPSADDIESMGIDDFYLDGVKYASYSFGTATVANYKYTAQLYVDYHRSIFLAKGNHTVLAKVYDRVVEVITYSTSGSTYNTNQAGYNFRLYVNSDGVYQGEYSQYGSLYRLTVNEFLSRGGTIEYYNEWNS